MRTRRVLAPCLLLLTACAAPAAAPTRAPASSRAAEGDDEWATASWEDRHDTMTWVVLPNMARAFQKFRGTSAAELTCRTCHGRDAEEVAYRMPHGLPALDRSAPTRGDAKMVAFMQREIVPQMASLTGKKDVTCFTCHPGR